MILVDKDILRAMDLDEIKIDPFDKKCLGTNSYDVHLGPMLGTYADETDDWGHPIPLSVKEKRALVLREIHPNYGMILKPGELYLASTIEYTESRRHVPMLNGKSSIGRLGLSIHVTAGTGDVGFCNHWTMELFVVRPLRVFAGMKIGQLLWFEPSGVPEVSYADKFDAKYRERSDLPQASEMARNFKP